MDHNINLYIILIIIITLSVLINIAGLYLQIKNYINDERQYQSTKSHVEKDETIDDIMD